MSDLLAIVDFDSPEFIDRCSGLYLTCLTRSKRAGDLEEQTQKRVDGMRRHSFADLAELGEAMLRVDEARPGEFGAWFESHEARLGFSARTAARSRAAASLVRAHGADDAFLLAQLKATAPRPEAIMADTLRLTKTVDELTHEERGQWMARLLPWVETYQRLVALEAV
jgi:hypothetical protein